MTYKSYYYSPISLIVENSLFYYPNIEEENKFNII